jgi:hypothetical protein
LERWRDIRQDLIDIHLPDAIRDLRNRDNVHRNGESIRERPPLREPVTTISPSTSEDSANAMLRGEDCPAETVAGTILGVYPMKEITML